jgi:hypothetical protein
LLALLAELMEDTALKDGLLGLTAATFVSDSFLSDNLPINL